MPNKKFHKELKKSDLFYKSKLALIHFLNHDLICNQDFDCTSNSIPKIKLFFKRGDKITSRKLKIKLALSDVIKFFVRVPKSNNR